MLTKDQNTDPDRLVEQARQRLQCCAGRENEVMYIPYILVEAYEIKYIKFIFSGNQWEFDSFL